MPLTPPDLGDPGIDTILPMPGSTSRAQTSAPRAVEANLAQVPLPHLVINDDRAIVQLIGALLERSGLSAREAARQLGIGDEAFRQYLKGRRTRPSLQWFIRFVQLCGARLAVEFPKVESRARWE